MLLILECNKEILFLLNIFFGATINAAFGVALQINNAFGALCNSIIIPLRPAMIKAYAEEKFRLP